MRMRTRRKWWFWGMWFVLPCGRLQLCGPRRPPLRPRRGGRRACPRAASRGRVAGGAGRDLAARRADPVGSSGRGRRGAAVSAFWARLGWAPATREGVWVGVRGREQFAWAALGGRGVRPGVSGMCSGGVCGSLGGVGVPWGVGLPAAGVCGLLGVAGLEGCSAGGSVAGVCGCLSGRGRPVSRGPGLRAMVGVCGPPGGEWGGRGRGGGCVVGCGAGVACVVLVYVSAFSGAPVWSLVGRAV